MRSPASPPVPSTTSARPSVIAAFAMRFGAVRPQGRVNGASIGIVAGLFLHSRHPVKPKTLAGARGMPTRSAQRGVIAHDGLSWGTAYEQQDETYAITPGHPPCWTVRLFFCRPPRVCC